ncbi:MAG: hypothetical protein R2844_21790 [Caldilineales bacterium]
MSAKEMAVDAADPNGKWLYRVGGLAAFAFGIAYLAIIALYVPMGARPSGAEAWLAYIAANRTTWLAVIGLSVLTDFLLVPIALSLYVALKGVHKHVMLIAAAFFGLFVVLDLALTWTNYAVGMALSSGYAAATNEAQRAALVTAAVYPSSVVESKLLFVYNSLTLAVAILVTGLVMLRGGFNKLTAIIGVATGILGLLAVGGAFVSNAFSTVAIVLTSLLTTAWVLLVGYLLYRLGRR